MSTNNFIPLAEVQSLEAHDFAANPDSAVQGALLDVARYGVAQLCNIGPVLTEEELKAMSFWAKHHVGDDNFDGLVHSRADKVNGRVDIFTPTIESFFGKLSKNTVAGLRMEQMCLRERKPVQVPGWHNDGTISQPKATGIRAIFPLIEPHDNSQSSLLVSRRTYDPDESLNEQISELKGLPIDSHLKVIYRPRSAVLMAEGPMGMKVICPGDDTVFGIESPLHAGWCDPENLVSRSLLVVDALLRKPKGNKNAFRIPATTDQLRRVV